MQKVKSKSSLHTFVTGQTDRGSKDAAIFSIRLEPTGSPVQHATEMPGSCGIGRSPVHLPVDASSLHEEIEPLVAGRTILEGPLWAQSRTEVGTMNLPACARSAAGRT